MPADDLREPNFEGRDPSLATEVERLNGVVEQLRAELARLHSYVSAVGRTHLTTVRADGEDATERAGDLRDRYEERLREIPAMRDILDQDIPGGVLDAIMTVHDEELARFREELADLEAAMAQEAVRRDLDALKQAKTKLERLLPAISALLTAQDRVLAKWADAEEKEHWGLWMRLHEAVDGIRFVLNTPESHHVGPTSPAGHEEED